MKKLLTVASLLLILSVIFISCQPKQEVKKDVNIPVTTKNEVVKQCYDDAMKALQEFKFKAFQESINKALAEDSVFFLGNYIMAMNNLNDSAKFEGFAVNAVTSENSTLSEGEQLLKGALEQLLADRKADVTENGAKLIELYPGDLVAYYQMLAFQNLAGDTIGQLETLKKALANLENDAPVYNYMGYVYMTLEEMDSAAMALDKYIELDPESPNPYDSKGDYFMKIEDYKSALKSYLKAAEVDSTWTLSAQKAQKAKAMCDSLKIE